MLPKSVVDEIVRLVAEGRLSLRQISKQVGVSRGTVQNIAGGRRPRQRTTRAEIDRESSVPARCPECGYLVYLPCVACRAENYARRKARSPAA
jgi:hypothetical protein